MSVTWPLTSLALLEFRMNIPACAFLFLWSAISCSFPLSGVCLLVRWGVFFRSSKKGGPHFLVLSASFSWDHQLLRQSTLSHFVAFVVFSLCMLWVPGNPLGQVDLVPSPLCVVVPAHFVPPYAGCTPAASPILDVLRGSLRVWVPYSGSLPTRVVSIAFRESLHT